MRRGTLCSVGGDWGLLMSALLSLTLVGGLAAGTWYMKYHFTLIPALAVFWISLLLSVGISAMHRKYGIREVWWNC